jgi:hypothetical protein
MEEVIKYKALDGSVFNTKKECLDYEVIIAKVNSIMCGFVKRPESSDFTNGKGYIQHDISTVNKAKKDITDYGNKLFNSSCGFGFIGRYFDDSGKKCLYTAWGRLNCMDDKGREWGQGYYAVNPDKAVQKPYNELK